MFHQQSNLAEKYGNAQDSAVPNFFELSNAVKNKNSVISLKCSF